MSAVHLGDQCHITIEMPDGSVFSGNALMATVSCFGDDHWREWDVEFRGIGPLWFEERGIFERNARKLRTEVEWKCPYCGAVMLRKHRQCNVRTALCGANEQILQGAALS